MPYVSEDKKESSWYKEAQSEKVVYIMRGLPGSGKSSLAGKIGETGVVFSTDDFFTIDGKYQYDPEMIGYAHTWNQGRAKKAMRDGVSPIVIDNTHVAGWEAKPYVEAAIANGYKIEVREPQTPWKFDAEALAQKNSHGVPLDIIQQMINNWEPNLTAEEILQSEKPKSDN